MVSSSSSSAAENQRNKQASTLPTDIRKTVHTLLTLIAQRLDIMPEIAELKNRLGEPVENTEREALVIDHSLAIAREIGLNEQLANRLIQAQISAAKCIQSKCQTISPLPGNQAAKRKAQLRKDIIDLEKGILTTLHSLEQALADPLVQQEVHRQLEANGADSHFRDEDVLSFIKAALPPRQA